MLYEGRVTSMDAEGRAWVIIPSLLGAEEVGAIPILPHVTPPVLADTAVYLSEVANSEDRFVIVGVIV